MKNKQLVIDYCEYLVDDAHIPEDIRLLMQRAMTARANAYAPYSGFNVGAALLMADGTMIEGTNQENGAYPSGLCAERVALFYANSQYKNMSVKAIAIAGGPGHDLTAEPLTPCGACRQVMLESQNRQQTPMEVWMVGKNKVIKLSSVDSLMTFAFDGSSLQK